MSIVWDFIRTFATQTKPFGQFVSHKPVAIRAFFLSNIAYN